MNIDNNTKEEILQDVKQGKKVKWKEHKLGAVSLVEPFKAVGKIGKASRVDNCGKYLTFKKMDDGHLRLHHANFCKVRLCPMCAWRRSLKVFGQVSKVMDYIGEHHAYRYIFITLTAKNVYGEMLPSELDKLFGSFNDLTKRKAFRKISRGWFRCLEVTHNWERGDYHPHFHMVLAVDKSYFQDSKQYMSHAKWVKLWQDCLGVEYEPVVNVKVVKPLEGTTNDFGKAVAEIAKYSVKSSDYINERTKKGTNEAVNTLDDALVGRRLIAFGGKFREVHKLLNLDDTAEGDLVHTDNETEMRDDLNFVLVKYNWNIGARNYFLEG